MPFGRPIIGFAREIGVFRYRKTANVAAVVSSAFKKSLRLFASFTRKCSFAAFWRPFAFFGWPGPSAEMCRGFLLQKFAEDFAADFPGGFFWALFLDNFIAHSKNATHLKLRKLPKPFRSSKVCDSPWTVSFRKMWWYNLYKQCTRCLGYRSKAQTCCADPCPQLFSFVLSCLAFLFFWGDGCVEMWLSKIKSIARVSQVHFHIQPRHWGNPLNSLRWSKRRCEILMIWQIHHAMCSDFPFQTSSFRSCFIGENIDTRYSRRNIFLTITQLTNFHTLNPSNSQHWVISQSLF